MSSWDVFHSERLEILRNLSVEEIRAAIAGGSLRDDDLVRPAGTSQPWARLAEVPALLEGTPGPPPVPSAEMPPATATSAEGEADDADQAAGVFEPIRTAEDAYEETTAVPPQAFAPATPDDVADAGPPTMAADTFAPPSDEYEIDASRFEIDEEPITEAELAGDFSLGFESIPEGQAPPGETREAETDDVDDARLSPGAETLRALLDDDELASLYQAPPSAGPPTLELNTLVATGAVPPVSMGLGSTAAEAPAPESPSYFEEDDAESDEEDEEFDPQDEDEEAAEFTLEPPADRAVEEIDLTAMVDVSFLLILFFLIAATSVFLKTLEIPEPNPEKNEAAAVQPRTIEDLESDFILVEIDPSGTIRVDHEPVAATITALAERLRQARKDSGRTAMLLTADTKAMHRLAVLAYDAANEIGLRIAIARPPEARDPAPPQPAASPPAPG